ncbi:hypothetical protein NitaCp042 (plastid) [Nicotiana tabacum]|uniref:Uncharacterized protein n=3 Tax=Nicotiana TaxID=4085 RepID=Q32718_TOBAC|nr:hypothetical protein NitaCp042 [Nicotiana tabacum]YP_004891624.1 hypothetical protein NiunC_p046 [Nicotiana undulata]YP_358696.1 hypothetical protein A4U62_pgp058 [Nicotiana sylvestris]AEO95693.1 hypothetical protein [synthetic construct]AEO95583.1 hypothetical protein [Nicotiana undulata]AMM05565.1 hypothetical protein [Nicotiana tabacum]CAA77369.1 hypothetical protein [Nicotiana tabacum]BAE46671.1 hypothetical protein [Nicotiana sylvestris]
MDSNYSIFSFLEYDLLLLFLTRPLTSSLKKGFQQQNCFHNYEKQISISRIYLNCVNMRISFVELKEFSIEWKMILHQQVKEKRNYLVLTFDTISNCVAVSEEG